jgi:hypothetical protein
MLPVIATRGRPGYVQGVGCCPWLVTFNMDDSRACHVSCQQAVISCSLHLSGERIQETWIPSLALPFTGCVTLGKNLFLSGPHLPQLSNTDPQPWCPIRVYLSLLCVSNCIHACHKALPPFPPNSLFLAARGSSYPAIHAALCWLDVELQLRWLLPSVA